MTTTEREMAGPPGREPPATRPPSSSALRRSAAIRGAIAVLLAGALTAAAIVEFWTPLGGKSDVLGYPIVADFNGNNYAHAYYLAVGLFPIAALLIFLGLTWVGPRVGLPVPPSRGPLRPLVSSAEVDRSRDPEPSLPVNHRIGVGVRVALVGAVLGLEVGIASNHLWLSIVLVTSGYAVLVALGSVALRRLTSSRSTWQVQLATANSLGLSLTVGALSLVSAHTGVQVVSRNSIHHYTWFPVWLGVPLAAALFAWLLVSLRRAGPARAGAIERRAVILIAAPVGLFLLVAALPGDLGTIELYEVGQFLTETRLVLHGWLPWRDVVVVHGLLRDVAPTAVGWALFGNSFWGAAAGYSLIFIPLTIVTTYWLIVYLVGRSWPILVIGTLIFLGTWLGTADARFLLWPLLLLVLAAVLRRFTRVRASALGVLSVVQAIVTPEMAAAVPIVAVVVAAYEFYWRAPGASLTRAFRRTIWVAIAVVASALAFAIYMASRGGLGALVSVTFDLLAGHFGLAIPPTPRPATQAQYDFIALAPAAALLISFGYAVVRLRLRRPFWLADWPMAATALYVLFYYTKFLTYMDLPHAYEPYMIATPLLLYIVYRAFTAAENWLRTRVPERRAGWLTAHPLGIALLICFVVLFWAPLRTVVEGAPARYRPTAPDPPIARVGYDAEFDATAVADLRQIVDAYLGPHDRLMDLTNEPALFYYFLGRDPSSRWFAPGAGLVTTPKLQRLLIGDLRRTRPKLIVFDDTDTKMPGLPAFELTPNNVLFYLVSRWVLDHYKPLVESHGRTIYGLPGLQPVSSLHLHLYQQPTTSGVPFLGQECSWGYAPSFLAAPAEPPPGAPAVVAHTSQSAAAPVTLRGWAGDLRTGTPAREVIATVDGRIVGQATPMIERPDVPAAGYATGFLGSGFQLAIPAWARSSKALKVLALGRDGSVAQLAVLNVPAQAGAARIGARTVQLQPRALIGHVDSESSSGRVVQIQPPAGARWSDYRWIEVDATNSGFRQGSFTISNLMNPTVTGHMISFETLPRSPHRYVIPASSCAQWRGYGVSRLFLTSLPAQQVSGVRLIR